MPIGRAMPGRVRPASASLFTVSRTKSVYLKTPSKARFPRTQKISIGFALCLSSFFIFPPIVSPHT